MTFFLKYICRIYIKNLEKTIGYFSYSFSSRSIGTTPTGWKILVYGTDHLSEVTLKSLNNMRSSTEGLVESLDIVCKQTECPVRSYATSKNLNIHLWPYDVPSDCYDVGIVVSFGHMIPSHSIFACKYGIINAHPSLLPRWRGAAPIFHTILNGDTVTGVTITQVSPNKFDVGNILLQEYYQVPYRCTSKKLTEDLSVLAAKMVLKTLRNLPEYIQLSYPQPTEGVTLARKIQSKSGRIDWENNSCAYIDRKFRAYDGFFDVYTTWKDMKVIIIEVASPTEVTDANISSLVTHTVLAGFCYFHKRRKILFVKCQDGWSGLTKLKIPKKGRITALEFYNGFMSKEDPNKCYFV